MTKKHFVALADAMRPALAKLSAEDRVTMIAALVGFCHDQNPNFNGGLWIAYLDGKCGPNGGAR